MRFSENFNYFMEIYGFDAGIGIFSEKSYPCPE
jgi:hypothetical protein